jgi:hypothetical protein
LVTHTRKSVNCDENEKPLTTEQIVAIVVGIALGTASVPRNDIARYFSNSLGELGGYLAAILAMAAIGAIVGLLVHALITRIELRRNSQA